MKLLNMATMTMMSLWLSTSTLIIVLVSAEDGPITTLPPHPANSGVFAAENVEAFFFHQTELFVTDCEKWADTFAWDQSAKFCDGFVKDVSRAPKRSC